MRFYFCAVGCDWWGRSLPQNDHETAKVIYFGITCSILHFDCYLLRWAVEKIHPKAEPWGWTQPWQWKSDQGVLRTKPNCNAWDGYLLLAACWRSDKDESKMPMWRLSKKKYSFVSINIKDNLSVMFHHGICTKTVLYVFCLELTSGLMVVCNQEKLPKSMTPSQRAGKMRVDCTLHYVLNDHIDWDSMEVGTLVN